MSKTRSVRSTASLVGENHSADRASDSLKSLSGSMHRHSLGDITNVPSTTGKATSIPKPIKVTAGTPSTMATTGAAGNAPRQGSAAGGVFMEVDQADLNNPQCVAEYVGDVYNTLRQEECNYLPRPDYLECQKDINAKMRSILVDWLVEVHMKYKLKSETLFLAVNIIDRFLEKRPCSRRRLQLVGVAAMLIAAKYEEIYPPEIADFVYICDKAYTKEDILTCEIAILTTLEFNLRVPTCVHFLDRYAKLNGFALDSAPRQLMQFIVELTLPDVKMVRYSPSHMAAAATLVTNKLLKRTPGWSADMAKYTKHSESAIKNCAKELCANLENAKVNPSSVQAVVKKFSLQKHQCVAKMSF